jgi:hypothetical protein
VQVPADARVRVHRFKAGGQARLIAFERNVEYKIREELVQAGGNNELEKPLMFTAKLSTPGHVVNLRSGENLGHVSEFRVNLDAWQPSLYAVLPEEPRGDVVLTLLSGLSPQ